MDSQKKRMSSRRVPTYDTEFLRAEMGRSGVVEPAQVEFVRRLQGKWGWRALAVYAEHMVTSRTGVATVRFEASAAKGAENEGELRVRCFVVKHPADTGYDVLLMTNVDVTFAAATKIDASVVAAHRVFVETVLPPLFAAFPGLKVSETFFNGSSPRMRAEVLRTQRWPFGISPPSSRKRDVLMRRFESILGTNHLHRKRRTAGGGDVGSLVYSAGWSVDEHEACRDETSVCVSPATESQYRVYWDDPMAVVATTAAVYDELLLLREVSGAQQQQDDLRAVEQQQASAVVNVLKQDAASGQTFIVDDPDTVVWKNAWHWFGIAPGDVVALAIAAQAFYDVPAVAVLSPFSPPEQFIGTVTRSETKSLAGPMLAYIVPTTDIVSKGVVLPAAAMRYDISTNRFHEAPLLLTTPSSTTTTTRISVVLPQQKPTVVSPPPLPERRLTTQQGIQLPRALPLTPTRQPAVQPSSSLPAPPPPPPPPPPSSERHKAAMLTTLDEIKRRGEAGGIKLRPAEKSVQKQQPQPSTMTQQMTQHPLLLREAMTKRREALEPKDDDEFVGEYWSDRDYTPLSLPWYWRV